MIKSHQEGSMINTPYNRPSISPALSLSEEQAKMNAIREKMNLLKKQQQPTEASIPSEVTPSQSTGTSSLPLPPVELPLSVVKRMNQEEKIYTESDLTVEKARAAHRAIEDCKVEIQLLIKTNSQLEEEIV